MPRSLFPDPVCKLPGEYGFVAAVLASPLDDLPKLVYADWLEERDDPRGTFLRAWLAARKAGGPLPKPDKKLSACWLSVVGFTLDAWLAKHRNPVWSSAVRATAEPCLMVQTIPLEDGETIPTGVSKMGGLPDLDPEESWVGGENSHAAFVAQWNLAELAVSPCAAKLPKQGLISYFIDLVPFVEDTGDGMSRVMFNREIATLEEREPDDDVHEYNELPACRVEFREWLSIPDYRSPVLKPSLSDEQRADYRDKYFHMNSYPQTKGAHRILGHAQPIQRDPTPVGKKAWSLLTEFGPDGDLRLEACDGGTWYFMTANADLKKRKFDETYMEFQSG